MRTYFELNKNRLRVLNNDKEVEHFLREGFKWTEEKLYHGPINLSKSGSCGLVALIKKNKIHVANAGTSRAILCRSTPAGSQTIYLSRDNKLCMNDEEMRIMKHGGKIRKATNMSGYVGEDRIWEDENGPGLTTTRGLGGF